MNELKKKHTFSIVFNCFQSIRLGQNRKLESKFSINRFLIACQTSANRLPINFQAIFNRFCTKLID